MDEHPVLRLPAPHRHQQCLQNNVRRLAALHRPADDTTGVEVDHDRQIGEAFLGPDVGDVRHPDPVRCCHVELPIQRVVDGHPDPVRCCHVELPIQRVVDDHGRLAAITARPTLVADPGHDAGQPRQACNAVRAASLALITQIVVQLAIAIHFAAVLPRSADKLGLAHIFPSPLAQRVLQPGIKAARVDAQTPTHRTHRKQRATLGNERVSHFAPRAKYAVAFLGCRSPPSPSTAHASIAGSRCASHHRPQVLRTSSSMRRASEG